MGNCNCGCENKEICCKEGCAKCEPCRCNCNKDDSGCCKTGDSPNCKCR